MVREHEGRSEQPSDRLSRRSVLQSTAGIGLGAAFGATTASAQSTVEDWGSSCDDAPVVAGTGSYTGTIETPEDEHYFRMQVDHGEYLEIDLSVPSSAEDPSLSIESPDSEAYTKRNPENVSFEASRWGEWIEIEPGLDGSFELWAEEDTVFCFRIYDGGYGGDLPYDLTFETERRTSAEPSDTWGDSCDGAPVVETTGEYTGTLVSPADEHFLRFVMEEGETLNVATSVPTAAAEASLSIESPDSEAYTKRNPENVSFEASRWGEWIDMEPGLDGSFELVAESGNRFCLRVYGSRDGGYPYDWTLAFNQDLSTGAGSASITGELLFSDDLLDEPVTNPVTIEVSATGAGESRSIERVVDASADTSPVAYSFEGLPVGEYQLTASVVSVGGDDSRSDEVSIGTDYDAVSVEDGAAVSGYDFRVEQAAAERASLSVSEFEIGDRSSAEAFPVDLLLSETAGVSTDDLDVTLSVASQRGDSVYESTVSPDPLAGGATIVTFGADGSTEEVGPLDGDAIAYEATVVAEAANADPVQATETFRVARATGTTTRTATTTGTATETPSDPDTETTTQPPTTESTRTDTATGTTAEDASETATEGDDETVSGSGPGFGVGGVLGALGGTGYLLKRRLDSEDRD